MEQMRGLKMDTLKILRNPLAFVKKEQLNSNEIVLATNDTALKIVEPQEEESKDPVAPELKKQQALLIVDKKQS